MIGSYAAILFDSDGVLIDAERSIARAFALWAEQYEIDGRRLYEEMKGRRSIEIASQYAALGMELAEARRLDALELSDAASVAAMPGARQATDSLGDRWAVVTSGPRDLLEARFAAADIPLPTVLVAAEDVTVGKPDPEGYQIAARRLGVALDECLILEDSEPGLRAANAAGCDVVAVGVASNSEFPWLRDRIVTLADLSFRYDQPRGVVHVDRS